MENQSTKNQIKETLLRRLEVQRITGLSRSALYAAIKDGTFPTPVKIGLRAVAWSSQSVADWIKTKVSGGSK
jgi:prophage regulatory protein